MSFFIESIKFLLFRGMAEGCQWVDSSSYLIGAANFDGGIELCFNKSVRVFELLQFLLISKSTLDAWTNPKEFVGHSIVIPYEFGSIASSFNNN